MSETQRFGVGAILSITDLPIIAIGVEGDDA